MTVRITLLAAACVVSLAACNRAPSPEETVPPAATATPATELPPPMPATVTPAPATAMPSPATAAPAAPAGEKPAAVVSNCATEIEGNDAMQFNVGSITVPTSCTKFTINLKHVGTMPVAAMGHNVVISKSSDMTGVTADGMAAGAGADYVKAGDARVVAHTKLVGGGESTSVTFDVSKIKDGGPYEFFCSFPGHSGVMKGTIAVG